MGEAVTDQPTFMPEPVDPDAEGADAIAPVWDPEDWPEMAAATPGDATPAASPESDDASARDKREAYVPFADREPEQPVPVAAGGDYFAASGPTAHDNHLGTYALFFGIVSVVATAALYFLAAGFWWLDAILGGVAVYYGVRGFNAASRGRATNRSSAVSGAVLGLLGALAAAVYIIAFAFLITSALK